MKTTNFIRNMVVVVMILFIGTSVAPSASGSAKLCPTGDATIVMGTPDGNYGSSTDLIIRNRYGHPSQPYNWEEDILIRFDISCIPPNSVVTSATLYLYYYRCDDSPCQDRELTLCRVTSDWDENTVTWNTKPSWTSEVTSSSIVPSTWDWMEWDVTGDVQTFVNGEETNYGWIIMDTTTWGDFNIPRMFFYAKENGSYIPYLEIITESVMLHPMDDATIVMGTPDGNYGSSTDLIIRNRYGHPSQDTIWEEDILIKFDLSCIPPNSAITSATFYLYYYRCDDSPCQDGELTLYRVTSDWDENTVTWNTKPIWTSEVTSSSIVPSTWDWMEWDVTGDVQTFVNGEETNYGWMIMDTTTWGDFNIPRMFFYAKENGSYIPYLQIATELTFIRGDSNGDGVIDLGDVLYLIAYLYKNGPAPIPLESGDVNCDATIDMGDVLYLINYLYRGGPAPICGYGSHPGLTENCGRCNSYHGLQKTAGPAQVRLVSSGTSKEGKKLMEVEGSFEAVVGAAQFEFSYDPKEIQTIIPELTDRTRNLNLFFSAQRGILKIGIVDLTGKHLIHAGKGPLVRLSITGSDVSSLAFEQAILVDENATPFQVTILPKGLADATLPQDFALLQNYPNPFNPETEISYVLPKASHVKLSIYNLLGQRIKTLVDEYQAAGHQTAHWDGTDEEGSEVASGIYFYKIQAGEIKETKKMILMK